MAKKVARGPKEEATLTGFVKSLDTMHTELRELFTAVVAGDMPPTQANAASGAARQIAKVNDQRMKMYDRYFATSGRVAEANEAEPKAITGAARIKQLESELAALKKAA